MKIFMAFSIFSGNGDPASGEAKAGARDARGEYIYGRPKPEVA